MEKETDFGVWYNDIVEQAGLSDKRYPVKGMNVWTGYGWKLMLAIDSIIRNEMDIRDHEEVSFPLLIPESEFQKEADHIKGFGKEVYWVTHAGENELDVKFCLRPTSETAMYPMFKLWIRSHADLPLRIYQIVNTFRYETKMTRSFIRVREIHFFEGHTAHATYESAEEQINEDLEILRSCMASLCLPYLVLKRPDWDKFAGAYYTLGVDCLMPTRKTLQLGSIHQYRTNFSVPYDVTFETDSGERAHVHQTTYGMSERLLGAVIGVHGDDAGLILPPAIATYQAVIVPILFKKSQDLVIDACKELQKELRAQGIRVHLDLTDRKPGFKFNEWEMKGVPVRIELGPKDLEKGSVVVVRRDTKDKEFIPRDELVSTLRETFDSISGTLLARAIESQRANIHTLDTIPEDDSLPTPEGEDVGDRDSASTLLGTGGIFRTGWCGVEKCGHLIEDRFQVNILGTPPQGEGGIVSEDAGSFPETCGSCGDEATTWVYFARTH